MDEGLVVVKLSPDEYTQTNSGNKIFKNASIFGSQNIIIHGKSILMRDCMLRGDLTGIRMGKFCFIGERTLIRASHRKFSKGATMFPMHVGDCVIVEEDCVLVAAQIGSYTHIGKGAIVGRSSIIKECCKVEAGAVIPSDSTFPPFSVIAGNPARVVGRVPECTQELISQAAKELYESYVIQR
ncbi:dnc-5 [Pristionchus pacificus]|uniref:Dynactin subunit 5 n=1 Tax=Pristionchus pacificus TaxID=54126 RepID=A0A2A6C9F9_PRIPA|nr:dnc-5 [Pristionchus pacificus]|eukprot:PDM74842.1 dnc-5 [Pristionchus pacificus]